MSKLEELLLSAIEHAKDVSNDDPWYAWEYEKAEEYLISINSVAYSEHLERVRTCEVAEEERRIIRELEQRVAEKTKALKADKSLYEDLSPREIIDIYS